MFSVERNSFDARSRNRLIF